MTRRLPRPRAIPDGDTEEPLDQQGETGADRPHLYGWCNDGFHAGRTYRWGTPCPGGLDQPRPCECPCHRTA